MFRAMRTVSGTSKLNPFRFTCIEEKVMETLVIKDIPITQAPAHGDSAGGRDLSREEMKLVQGGRAISVLVDGRPGGVVDDFQLNMGIFTGDIGVRVV
jgi:hypothetical protein